jgi:anti-sigma regulatory factor (Ser/Thr protein kinase)/NAD-dependent dihydropyrimidine dehydrogenase PreA subunit
MSAGSWEIAGGDYDRAGSASRALKEALKRVGLAPADLRRAMIAAYEAELNVVIHAQQGTLSYTLGNGQLEVTVEDRGPGIPDVDQAMREGYSTAPPEARALGFGAGMGLPNIKKNADRLDIRSEVGRGTRVSFGIRFRPQAEGRRGAHSLLAAAGACIGCMRCLHVCPTMAVRVHKGVPTVLDHLCIDCTACLEVCKTGALRVDGLDDLPDPAGRTLVAPAAFLVEFGPRVRPQRTLEALTELGFREVRVLEAWESALRAAVVRYAREEARALPVIAPVCPAVVNLIALRFPALLGHVAPFRFALEAAALDVDTPAVIVRLCPAGQTLLRQQAAPGILDVIGPAPLRKAVFPLVSRGETGAVPEPARAPADARESDRKGILQVSNVRNDMSVLEKAESGLLHDIRILELYACDGGCFGSPLLTENALLGGRRWQRARCRAGGGTARALRRGAPWAPLSGLRLDADLGRAIQKLSEIDAAVRRLPGRDCGLCGAPTCAAMAEDVVLGRADLSECLYLARHSEETP